MTAGYVDPELLIAQWLHDQTGQLVHADPNIDKYLPFTAPVGHVQRGAGEGDFTLTLDSVLLDVDWYAHDADHARDWAGRTWNLLRFKLPLTTFDNGILARSCSTITAPFWAPATGVYRRSATYRVMLAGVTS